MVSLSTLSLYTSAADEALLEETSEASEEDVAALEEEAVELPEAAVEVAAELLAALPVVLSVVPPPQAASNDENKTETRRGRENECRLIE
ncbi:hypothetical protein [Uliginosibacterium aquaticum]|uniref:hypothetical protein n=1 Tax=Uliginosibacterium aquaticum TaxID=2731212 RepID=UPI00156EE8B3|nr:hypothetical protein [Uliginosibacterium aquaticum]